MKVTKTQLQDVLILEPTVFEDTRGWFMETYSKSKLKDLGLDFDFVQDNHSYSQEVGVLRGLHCQLEPKAQAKLVRCIKGSIIDVAVDLREGSPTYLQSLMVELSADNKKQLLIPKGFAHGFLTLTADCEVVYKVDNVYSKEHDRSVRYDDPTFALKWPDMQAHLSQKDADAPTFKESDIHFVYKEVKE
jgi:dTDP-4-dehydrorhamnose 3,5-epimerase